MERKKCMLYQMHKSTVQAPVVQVVTVWCGTAVDTEGSDPHLEQFFLLKGSQLRATQICNLTAIAVQTVKAAA